MPLAYVASRLELPSGRLDVLREGHAFQRLLTHLTEDFKTVTIPGVLVGERALRMHLYFR